MLTALGDKPSGSATESRDSSGNSVTPCRKKKLTSCRRSYEKQNPENKHLYLKPFHSDPTNSSSCGHLALANKLSYVYKPRHGLDCSVTGTAKDDDNKPERLHQQLKRQLAIKGNNDPRAASLAQTYNVSYKAERSCPDMGDASNEPSVDLPTRVTNVSSCGTKNSRTDNAIQLDMDSSLPCTNHVARTKPGVPQRASFGDVQQFFAVRRSSQDHLIGDRFSSPVLASTTACVGNMYIVRPVVFPYDYTTDLHPCRQFPAPPLMPRIHMSPSCPQMFVYQPRSYLPQKEQMRPSVISSHRFLHR